MLTCTYGSDAKQVLQLQELSAQRISNYLML